MKRILSVLILLMIPLAILFSMSACNGSISVEPMLDFSADIYVDDSYTKGVFAIEAELVNNTEGLTLLTVSSPDELWGMSYKWSDGLQISLNGLSVKTESEYLPETSFANMIKQVLKDLRGRTVELAVEDEYAVFAGKCGGYDYTVRTDRKGYIQSLCVSKNALSVHFLYESETK